MSLPPITVRRADADKVSSAFKDYGIGNGTLWTLAQDDDWHAAFITTPKRPGPIRLTRYGQAVVDGLRTIPGVTLE